ncbi:MAG: choice-of-anchor Q domain-containing protein [Gaiellaceae bacterium]
MTPPRRLLLITGFCGVVALTGLLPQAASAGLRKLYVSPRGSDAGRCTKARPCRSFDRAYRVARPGQSVIARGGVYGDQTVRPDRQKKSNRNVVFRSAKGAKVVIATDLDVHGSHITFTRMRLVENWYAHPGARDLVFSRIRAQRFYITSARNIRVLRSNFGPSINAVAQIKSATGSGVAPKGIVLNRVYMHDFRRTSSQHMECLHVMAVDGLVIRRSRFRDCSIFDISFNLHGDSNKMRRILIENSYFDKTLDDGHYAVHFSSGGRCEALIRYNTFLQGISSQCAEGGAGVRIHSNILPKSPTSCRQNGYSWNWNVYERGRRCGRNDRVARVRFVNRLRFDLRLARRSAAIGRGNPKSFPRADILGKRRPSGRKPDAGAHERR